MEDDEFQIKEGYLTVTDYTFIEELIFEPRKIENRFREKNNELLRKREFGEDWPYCGPYQNIDGIGTSSGYWEPWSDYVERVNNFHYNHGPRFIKPNFNIDIVSPIDRDFNLENYDINLQIIYYPCGLFCVRFQVYFDFSEPLSDFEFGEFRKEILSNFEKKRGKNTMNVSSDLHFHIRQRILKSVFDGDPPERFSPRFYDKTAYDILYIYEGDNIKERIKDRTLVSKLKGDDGSGQHPIEEVDFSDTECLLSSSDLFAASSSMAIIYTPSYSENSARLRREKRVKLRNKTYISTDWASLEENHFNRLKAKVREAEPKLRNVVILQYPLAWELDILLDMYYLPDVFNGTDKIIHDHLSPNSRVGFREELDNYERKIEGVDTVWHLAIRKVPVPTPLILILNNR